MRRTVSVLAGVTALLVGFAGQASAEKATVSGSGDIKKLFANNGSKTAVAKVYGLSKPCDQAQYVHVAISSKKDGKYNAEAGCVQGTWSKGLFYDASGTGEGADEVDCPGFKLGYNSDHHFFKVVIPRSCLKHAPDRIRMSAEGQDFGTTTGGTAGPTKLLDRG